MPIITNALELQNILVKYHQLHGYQLMETPLIDDAELFLSRAGDQIIENLFVFERRGKTLSLRPEFTAPAMSQFVTQKLSTPVRWQFIGATFIDRPSDYSQNYQHLNAGVEFIGQDSAEADAEVIALAYHGAIALGISAPKVAIGHVGLQLHLLGEFGLDPISARLLMNRRDFAENTLNTEVAPERLVKTTTAQKMLDIILDSTQYGSTMGGRSREEIVERLTEKHEKYVNPSHIREAIAFLDEWKTISLDLSQLDRIRQFIKSTDNRGQAILNRLEKTLELLGHHAIAPQDITLKPALAQNWDYYTGIVFHIYDDQQSIVVSGGRYNDLSSRLDSPQSIPAVGFAYYLDQLVAPTPATIKTVSLVGEMTPTLLDIARQFRSANVATIVQSSLPDAGYMVVYDTANLSFNGKTYAIDSLNDLINDLKAIIG